VCGILGVLGPAPNLRLRPALLRHRGPDGSGSWSAPAGEPPASFAHTRLAIVDLSADGNQPMHSACGRYVIVFNGEIYNFLELRAELEATGHRFCTATDTEVFLQGLIVEGAAFQLRCNGMWAFCLWDRLTGSAVLGRDRFGKKPLFHTRLPGGALAFASEMKALYPLLPSVRPSRRIRHHFGRLFDYEHTEDCVIEGIRRLPPGHWAFWHRGELTVRRWWNTLDHLETPPGRYEDQVERWRELFLDAVRLRMRADVRIGTALSGGLDSSAVFCAMAHIAGDRGSHERQSADWQHGFCAHYPGSSLDETPWARLVTDSIGVPLEAVAVDPLDCGWSIEQALYQVEDPYLTVPLPMLATYRAISRAGIKVTLDGHGADELFSGYGHLNVAMKDSTAAQVTEIEAIHQSTLTGVYSIRRRGGYSRRIKHRLLQALRDSHLQPRRRLAMLRGRLPASAVEPLRYADQNHPAFQKLDALGKALYELFHITVLPTLLRNYDRYSMASGVEVRMPFLDWRLVCFTFSLPWTSKLGGSFTKRIMRDALRGILPEAIRCRRDKIGWNAPFHEWLQGPLKDRVEALLRVTDQDSAEGHERPGDMDLTQDVAARIASFQATPSPTYKQGEALWCALLPAFWRHSLNLADQ
jgi:asparagine synthase (glutamine-hydrolysing)